MNFVIVFAAWVLFVFGFCNMYREAYVYATASESQHHDWLGLLWVLVAALSFSGWWMLLMKYGLN